MNLEVKDNYRIIAISDVHGHHNHLKELIDKVNLRDDDYLVIIGDFINKGPDSYKTYKLVKKLLERSNTYVLKGNHEQNIQMVMASPDIFKSVYEEFKLEKYETLINSIFRHANLDPHIFNSAEQDYKYLHKYHGDVFEFIEKLPIILNLDEFRFVHGGYDEKFCLINDERKFLKYDYFNELSSVNDKTTVVGHWPSCLLRKDILSNAPYFNKDKRVISIDGGMGVKNTSELNALVIEKNNGCITYDCISYSDFKKKKVIKKCSFVREEKIHIKYPHYSFEILEEDDSMSLCRHIHTNKKFSIFNSLIMEYEGELVPKIDYVNNFLNLEIGTEVEVCEIFCDCTLVKHNKEFGWLMNYQIS